MKKRFLSLTAFLILLFSQAFVIEGCGLVWPPKLPQFINQKIDELKSLAENSTLLKETPEKLPTGNTKPLDTNIPEAVIKQPLPSSNITNTTAAEISRVERKMLDLINRDRLKKGLSTLAWDETAAESARKHVQEETSFGYISHWGMDGSKPQLRYTQGGGLDAVDENESVTLWSEEEFNGVSEDDLYKIVSEHETSMLNEKPPNDGHRKNILDPHHTHVGIAVSVGKYGVAMAQEFTNHYTKMNPVPLTSTAGSKINLSGQIFPGYIITGIYAVWEQLPQPMTKAELLQTHSYSDPPFDNLHFFAKPNGQGFYIATASGNIFAKNLKVDKQGNFAISVPLTSSHALDYLTVEIAPAKNPDDRFYAAQFVVKH